MATSKKESRKQRRESARLARIEAQRKRERARKIRRNLIVLLVVLAAVAAVTFFVLSRRQSAGRIDAARLEAGCSEIMRHEEEGSTHVEAPATVEYESNPPSSGNHYGQTARWGVYRETVQAEILVHNLEHGGVVVHYRSDDLTSEEIEALEDLVEGYPDSLDIGAGVILNPSDDIPTPVAMASWQHTQTCEEVSIIVVRSFIEERCGKGPEKFPLACT